MSIDYTSTLDNFISKIHHSFEFMFSEYGFAIESSKAEQAHGDGTPRLEVSCESETSNSQVRFYAEAGFSVSVRFSRSEKALWCDLESVLEFIEQKKTDYFASPEEYNIQISIEHFSNLLKNNASVIFESYAKDPKKINKIEAYSASRDQKKIELLKAKYQS